MESNDKRKPTEGQAAWTETDALDSIIVTVEPEGDFTVRPGRPSIVLGEYPRPRPPKSKPRRRRGK